MHWREISISRTEVNLLFEGNFLGEDNCKKPQLSWFLREREREREGERERERERERNRQTDIQTDKLTDRPLTMKESKAGN